MDKTRWQQRFKNFERAFNLLQSVFEEKSLDQFSDLEKDGLIKRFKYSFELSWKTLKDYLEYTGIVLKQITPREIIKQASSAKILEDGQAWIDMLEHHNIMSHTYNPKTFEVAIEAIAKKYLKIINQVYLFLKKQR